ncbi:uncharacterized protein SCODWIG_02556 [Saccharomycodes ludwigii]|uniref:Nucleoporin NUP192 n=2 Tax=Saccharomycodes ludwigii TaxID=36035 RepID=A0A376B7Z7_9ASCO|nr:uncharacterized protein SCODWIG_02556 [Saccharomycodes ludwigii]
MKSCYNLMISALSDGEENSTNVFHFVNINNNNFTWDSIATCISEYILKISNWEIKQQQQQKLKYETLNNNNNNNNNLNSIGSSYVNGIINEETINENDELSEEVVIYLSSLFTLISSISAELPPEHKNQLFNLFPNVLFEFLKLNTPLVGAALETLTSLVPEDENQKSSLWNSLDKWIFHSNYNNLPTTSNTNVTMATNLTTNVTTVNAVCATRVSVTQKNFFISSLTNFKDILGFLKLFSKLIAPSELNSQGFVPFGKLLVPIAFGTENRIQVNIAPYLEYIINDVLANSVKIINQREKHALQDLVYDIILSCLSSFDYTVILNSVFSIGTNLDSLVPQQNFIDYIMESPMGFILNFLFDEPVYKIIFQSISCGYDTLLETLNSQRKGQKIAILCDKSLQILDKIFTLQDTFIDEIYPLIKRQSRSSSIYYVPRSIGLHGLRNFFDAILFNLPLIAQIALYVGVDNFSIASTSISLLNRITVFNSNKSIVLSTLDSIDESSRIKQCFIDQLNGSIVDKNDFALKLQIINFIKNNLSSSSTPTVSHFILGFQITPILSIGSPELSTYIASDSSVLKTLITIILDSLAFINKNSIDYYPIKLASEAFSIISKLCSNNLTGQMTLKALDDETFFEKLLELGISIDIYTKWNGHTLESLTQSAMSFETLLSFLTFRCYLLSYFSLEIHRLNGTDKGEKYVTGLTTSLVLRSPKIFSYLDTIRYLSNIFNTTSIITNSEESLKKLSLYKTGIDMSCILKMLTHLEVLDSSSNSIFDFSSLDALLDLRSDWLAKTKGTAVDLTQKQVECNLIKNYISTVRVVEEFNTVHLSVLHSWVQLVQVMVTENPLSPIFRSNFIMEIFEAIIPKVADFVDSNIEYTEELVSLCVFLYDLYDKDRKLLNDASTSIDRKLYSLFQTCIYGIVSPLSTLSLRSDFYVMCTKFISNLLKQNKQGLSLAKEILYEMKMSSENLVQVVGSDALCGEGSHRITSILFLNSLVQLASLGKVNFVLENLSRSNMLLLIIRSLKATDELLYATNENISVDRLLYELTAFKTTMNFLIRIAETKAGAQELIQNEVFKIISSCEFLQLDPDLGLELVFNELFNNGVPYVEIKLNLDKPLTVKGPEESNTISLFELFVPVFQLLTAIVLSMGSENKYCLKSVRKLLYRFRKLVQGVVKKDALIESGDYVLTEKNTAQGLQELLELIVLLCTLTGYVGEDS